MQEIFNNLSFDVLKLVSGIVLSIDEREGIENEIVDRFNVLEAYGYANHVFDVLAETQIDGVESHQLVSTLRNLAVQKSQAQRGFISRGISAK